MGVFQANYCWPIVGPRVYLSAAGNQMATRRTLTYTMSICYLVSYRINISYACVMCTSTICVCILSVYVWCAHHALHAHFSLAAHMFTRVSLYIFMLHDIMLLVFFMLIHSSRESRRVSISLSLCVCVSCSDMCVLCWNRGWCYHSRACVRDIIIIITYSIAYKQSHVRHYCCAEVCVHASSASASLSAACVRDISLDFSGIVRASRGIRQIVYLPLASAQRIKTATIVWCVYALCMWHIYIDVDVCFADADSDQKAYPGMIRIYDLDTNFGQTCLIE